MSDAALRRTWRILFFAGIALWYYAFATNWSWDPMLLKLSPQAKDAYSWLAEGYLQGHLHLSQEPIKLLTDLADPYDPGVPANWKIPDMLLYKGHYYMQHGPLPVLALHLPLKLLAGGFPNYPLTILVFMTAGVGFYWLLLLRIKDQHFPQRSEAWVYLGGISLALGSGAMYLLSRPLFYEACIASSFAFMAAALWRLHHAVASPGNPTRDLALASALAGLSAMGRPNFALPVAVLALAGAVWLWQARPTGAGSRSWFLKRLAALWLPAVLAGCLIAWHNWARFDSPFEYGTRYQLAGIRMEGSGFIHPALFKRNLGFNLKMVFVREPTWSGSFPFLKAKWGPQDKLINYHPSQLISLWGDGPPGATIYYGEEMVGFFTLWPAGWVLLLLPSLLFLYTGKRAPLRDQAGPLPAYLGLACCVALAILAMLLLLSASTHRYTGDFSGLLMMLAWCSALLLFSVPFNTRVRRAALILYLGAFGSGVVVSLLFGFCGFRGETASKVRWLAVFINDLLS